MSIQWECLRGPSKDPEGGTGLAWAGWVEVLASAILAGRQDQNVQLCLAGGPAIGESPEQPSVALQKERLSLTPEVRLPGVPGALGGPWCGSQCE